MSDDSDTRHGLPRREVLTAAGAVAVAGCSGLVGSASYEEADIELSFDVACTDDDSDEKVVTFSWTWASGDGGSDPPDLATIYWDESKWDLVEGDHDTSEAVRYIGPGERGGMVGVTYAHDDAAAEAETTYAASCRLAPTGEFSPNARNVAGEFIHRVGDGTPAEERTGAPPKIAGEWDKATTTDAAAAPCVDDGA